MSESEIWRELNFLQEQIKQIEESLTGRLLQLEFKLTERITPMAERRTTAMVGEQR
jgi:hypothetical protein